MTNESAEARLREALEECIVILELVECPANRDMNYRDEVGSLGDRIGFGALMSAASAEWRARLIEEGVSVGGEFVAGPCHVTVLATLEKARNAISAVGNEAKKSEGGKKFGPAEWSPDVLNQVIEMGREGPSDPPDRREIVARIIQANVSSKADPNFVERRYLTGVDDAAFAILAALDGGAGA